MGNRMIGRSVAGLTFLPSKPFNAFKQLFSLRRS
jgi:hypothetical protein